MITVVEIKNQIISHFYSNSIFDIDIDGQKIKLDEGLEPVRKETLNTVMQDLAARGMVIRVNSPQKSIWLLTQSFDTFSQTVVLSAPASEAIAEIINDFRDANEIQGDQCDKTKLNESDIMNLVNIIYVLLEDNSSELVSQEDEEDQE